MSYDKIKKSIINPRSFVTINPYMIDNLKLSLVECIIYSIIFNFSMKADQEFIGGSSYLMYWTGESRSTVYRYLKKLIERGLIAKRSVDVQGLKVNRFVAVENMEVNPRICQFYKIRRIPNADTKEHSS